MKISKNNRKDIKHQGFTLVELVVVIAGLAALGAFTIPAVLNSIKINKIEEAKALMNSYAADCLGKYRLATDPIKFVEDSIPEDLDNEKLLTLGYQIDGDKSKCSHTGIKPSDKDDNFLYAFDFRISSEGKVLKTATPSDNPSALNSCKGWAGKNCGLSEAQKAEFARLEALAKAKATCISNYQLWLGKSSSGEFKTWNNEKETCTKQVFAFEGTPVASKEAIDEALKAKYGRACQDWREAKIRNNKYVSPSGKAETKNPECGGVQYWFHTGSMFTSQADWTERDNKIKQQACVANRSQLLSRRKSGKHTYGPTPGPDPCGKTVWLCNGQEYATDADYKTTSCGAPPPPPPPPKPKPVPPKQIPDRSRPGKIIQCGGSKPAVCNNPFLKWRLPQCQCWNNL